MWIHVIENTNSEHIAAHKSILRALGAKEKQMPDNLIAFAFEELPKVLEPMSAEWFEGDWEKIVVSEAGR